MRKKLIFSFLVLLLALGFQAVARTGETNQSCTICCDTDPSICCTSEVGDCRIVYGGYNKLYCDGILYRCLSL
jgi:hypothetical protein